MPLYNISATYSRVTATLWSHYLLNSVVLVLPDLLGLCHLFLFQHGGVGDVPELSSCSQLGHQLPESRLPPQNPGKSVRWGGEHTQTLRIF